MVVNYMQRCVQRLNCMQVENVMLLIAGFAEYLCLS